MAKKKATTSKYSTLHELLILKLQTLHDVEKELIKALPKMAKAATDPALKSAFSEHLEETKTHEARIDQALEHAGDTGKHKQKSEAIRGLIKDAQWCIKNVKEPRARDAILIAAAQYVEHYEMAGYGAARTWAEDMGHAEISDLLQLTLTEEGNANKKLTSLAEGGINENVASGMEEQIAL
ncbi:MAG: yciF [Candidatus Kaiserbacteria bacterium]|nr:yciF [Candidatus Kaiserbacteria bacterium]